jgi:SAM-dependent methyltransferase
MKHRENWVPGKFVYRSGKLVASRDTREVDVSSRLITDLIAKLYDDNLRQHARGSLLDLGCGKVPLFATYEPYVSAITCVDWSNTLHRNEHLDLEHDLNQPLPFEDGVFDTLLLSDVLEHIAEPDFLFREMARVLAPGGKILMNVPFFYHIHEQPHDYYRYTEFALRRFVERSGMEPISVEIIGGVPEVLADIVAKLTAQFPLGGKHLSTLIQATTRLFVKGKIGKRISNKTGRFFPLGYFLIAAKQG